MKLIPIYLISFVSLFIISDCLKISGKPVASFLPSFTQIGKVKFDIKLKEAAKKIKSATPSSPLDNLITIIDLAVTILNDYFYYLLTYLYNLNPILTSYLAGNVTTDQLVQLTGSFNIISTYANSLLKDFIATISVLVATDPNDSLIGETYQLLLEYTAQLSYASYYTILITCQYIRQVEKTCPRTMLRYIDIWYTISFADATNAALSKINTIIASNTTSNDTDTEFIQDMILVYIAISGQCKELTTQYKEAISTKNPDLILDLAFRLQILRINIKVWIGYPFSKRYPYITPSLAKDYIQIINYFKNCLKKVDRYLNYLNNCIKSVKSPKK